MTPTPTPELVELLAKARLIKDREQLIYDLRKFADKSMYLTEISKIGANEIINFLIKQLNEPILSALTALDKEWQGKYDDNKLKAQELADKNLAEYNKLYKDYYDMGLKADVFQKQLATAEAELTKATNALDASCKLGIGYLKDVDHLRIERNSAQAECERLKHILKSRLGGRDLINDLDPYSPTANWIKPNNIGLDKGGGRDD